MNGLAGLLAGRPRLDRVLMHASGGMDFSARLGVFKVNVTGAQGLAGLLAGRPPPPPRPPELAAEAVPSLELGWRRDGGGGQEGCMTSAACRFLTAF